MPQKGAGPLARRDALAVRPNPDERVDYVVSLVAPLSPDAAQDAETRVDYVPDRAVLTAGGFAAYLDGLSQHAWPDLETLGLAILDDLRNELVPRWVRVGIRTVGPAPSHAVTLEESQPHWSGTVTVPVDLWPAQRG